MAEYFKYLEKYEIVNLENYCKKYESTGKFNWKKIEDYQLTEIIVKVGEDVYTYFNED